MLHKYNEYVIEKKKKFSDCGIFMWENKEKLFSSLPQFIQCSLAFNLLFLFHFFIYVWETFVQKKKKRNVKWRKNICKKIKNEIMEGRKWRKNILSLKIETQEGVKESKSKKKKFISFLRIKWNGKYLFIFLLTYGEAFFFEINILV